MGIIDALGKRDQRLENKKLLFEYLVYLLEQWKQENHPSNTQAFTKLKLQKILFLVASINATIESHLLLDVFNKFYALPYGPVEIEIYDAMNSAAFRNISFNGNDCKHSLTEQTFSCLDANQKNAMIEAIKALKDLGADYIITPPFDLVDITHKWTSWQVAMQVAEMFGNKREQMSTEDIINSTVKAYK